MQHLKAFIAGIILPSILVPVGLLIVTYAQGKTELLSIPLIHLLPILWGVWNILYFAFFRDAIQASPNIRLLITGALLGFIVAAIGTFWLNIPGILGISGQLHCLPLILLPIIYALLWRYIVKPLNSMVGLPEETDKV